MGSTTIKKEDIVPLEERKYDIIVVGATGFTGSFVTKHLAHNAPNLSWAIAGRSRQKLEKLVEQLGQLPEGVNAPDILIIDVLSEDEQKVKEMLEKTRLVVDVVGPYSYYGEKVLRPCILAGTAWVDLNGETPWHKDMLDKYQTLAEETGAVVVPSCGFDCIPSDLSVYMLSRFAERPLGNVDAVVEEIKGGYSFGTLSSFLAPYKMYPASWIVPSTGYLGNPYFLFNAPTSRFDSPLPVQPTGTMTKSASKSIYYSGDLAHTSSTSSPPERQWGGNLISSSPMEGINRPIVMRSYGIRSETKYNSYGPSFRYREWMLSDSGTLSKFLGPPIAFIFGYGLPYLLSIPIFRNLINYGINKLTGEGYGPDKELQENGGFRWKAAAEVIGHEPRAERAVIKLEGKKDPGYGWTGIILAETALYILGRLRGDDGVVARPGEARKVPLQENVRRLIEVGREERDDVVFDHGRKGGFWTTAALGVGLVERLVGSGYLDAEMSWVVDEDAAGEEKKTK